MPQNEELQRNSAYRLALLSLAGLALGVFGGVVGVIVKISTGNTVLLVFAFVLLGFCVVLIWSALIMLLRWARQRQRSEGITSYDALMQVRHQLDLDVRRLLGRTPAGRRRE